MRRYDWVVFTSANGVRFAKERLLALGKDARAFGAAKIAAIGDATADAVRRELCLKVDLSPERFVAEALAKSSPRAARSPASDSCCSGPTSPARCCASDCRKAGRRRCAIVPIYDTKPAASCLPTIDRCPGRRRSGLDHLHQQQHRAKIWWTCSATVTRKNSRACKIASIGPITSQTLRALGLPPTIEASTYDTDGLVDALMNA